MAERGDVQVQHCELRLGEFSKALNNRLWPTTGATRNKRDDRVKLAAKSLASHMARAAAQPVTNRHERAELKAVFYVQLGTVLEAVCLRERKLHQLYTRTILSLCCLFAVVLITVLVDF